MAKKAITEKSEQSFLARRFKEEMDALRAGKVVPLVVDAPADDLD
jgi:hypothetical protein